MRDFSPKLPANSPPVARSGAGDISEVELSRERNNLSTTPPARMQPAHPKKQLFSAPATAPAVSKFTARTAGGGPSSTLARIRDCLDAYESQTPRRPAKIGPKAVSMEDLTPTKRNRRERKDDQGVSQPPGLHSVAEESAAAKVCRVMVIAAWRRRRDEVRCLRKTLEFQVSCSDRLRMQVSALKSLLESDNHKVRLAMRELDRLKQLLKDKEIERALLEQEKLALENDVIAAEDRASEMSIGWRNCRNEVESARAATSTAEQALALERAAAAEARAQRDHAYSRLSMIEEDLVQHEELLSAAENEVADLKRENADKQRLVDQTREKLRAEKESRERCSRECRALAARVAKAGDETAALRGVVRGLQAETARLGCVLAATQAQLDWWPKPLTKFMGAARSWLRAPSSLPDAVVWSMTTNAKPASAKAANAKLTNAKEANAKAAIAKPSNAKEANAKAANAKVANAKPKNAKPANAKPANAKPANAKPANAKPANAKAANAKPANAKPANAKPANAKPANAKLANAKSANAKPASAKAANAKPANAKPANAKPANAKAVNAKPANASGNANAILRTHRIALLD